MNYIKTVLVIPNMSHIVFVFVMLIELAMNTTGFSQYLLEKPERRLNVGDTFPSLRIASLAGSHVNIPEDCRGRKTLITVAYIQKAQYQIDSWAEPILKSHFGKPDFQYYEIPIIWWGYGMLGGKRMIDSGMRSGIVKERHPNVLTIYDRLQDYYTYFGSDRSKAYVFLLNASGEIIYMNSGFATENDLKELSTLLQD